MSLFRTSPILKRKQETQTTLEEELTELVEDLLKLPEEQLQTCIHEMMAKEILQIGHTLTDFFNDQADKISKESLQLILEGIRSRDIAKIEEGIRLDLIGFLRIKLINHRAINSFRHLTQMYEIYALTRQQDTAPLRRAAKAAKRVLREGGGQRAILRAMLASDRDE